MVRDARSRAPHHEGLIPTVTISDSSCPHLLALVAGIHVFRAVPHQKAWMAGTSPATTMWAPRQQPAARIPVARTGPASLRGMA